MKTIIYLPFILSILLVAAACGQGSSSPIALQEVTGSGPGKTKNGSLRPTLLSEVVRQGVPQAVATLAFAKYDSFAARVDNGAYISIVDFTQHSGKPRFYMVDTATGHVDNLLVAHGTGSDPNATGTPVRFSNVPDSKMSSVGAYIVSEKFQSSHHGTAARLDGLEATNSMARNRAVILHSASYVNTSLSKMGMSWGCPAVSLDWISKALSRLSNGSFLFAYGKGVTSSISDNTKIQEMMMDPTYQWVNEAESAPVDGEF